MVFQSRWSAADYNKWNLQPPAEDLKGLFSGAECPEFILLDYPFAYVHNELKSHIDYAIFIDTPLDWRWPGECSEITGNRLC